MAAKSDQRSRPSRIGNAIAAPITGVFLAVNDYQSPIFIAAATITVAAALNHLFFNRLERSTHEPFQAV